MPRLKENYYKTMVTVAVHFIHVYPSRQVQAGAGVALAALPTPHDCQEAVLEALQNAALDHERWKTERLTLGALAARKAVANRKNHWLAGRNGHPRPTERVNRKS